MTRGYFRFGSLAACLLLAAPVFAGTVDRFYQFGDDSFENGVVGSPAGVNFGGLLLTFDSVGTSGANDLNDLQVVGGPTYANTNSRPAAASDEVGIRFDGTNDYLFGDNLNSPANSRSSIDYLDNNGNPVPGPFNYRGIVNRSLQFWVRPDAATLNDGQTQALVLDSNQHGALIDGDGSWVLRYAGANIDSGIAADSQWHHVMVARPYGTSGDLGGARMWVDGIAVAAAGGGYDGSSRERLVVGANTSLDANGNFNGGSSQFFRGLIDNLVMSVYGDNSSNAGPPAGRNYGSFDFAVDNEFAADVLTGIDGDLNQDGSFNGIDRTAFIGGWLNENRINGLLVGDLSTLSSGDLNFDGRTDLSDLVRFQQALTAAGMPTITSNELVPEPVTGTLASAAAAFLLFFRRR